jgi:hypothetical protein
VLRIVGAHGWVRDLLRADGLGEKVGGFDRIDTLDGALSTAAVAHGRLIANLDST